MAHFNLDLDLDKSQAVGQVVRARVGDVESCVIAATIYDHGSEVSLAGMGARFCMLKPDRTVIEDDDCEVSGSTVTHTLGTQATAAAGVAELAYFEILDGSTVIDSTQGFRLVVEPDAEGSGTGPSEDYISRVDAATEAANDAAEAATGAAQSATAAAGAAEEAASSANDAAGSANGAAQSATTAAGSANAAAKTANDAAGAADEATSAAQAAATDAEAAAQEARDAAGAISEDLSYYFGREMVGDVSYLTLYEDEEAS